MRLALDAMGGDFAPQATVEGAVVAARELGLEIVLVGDRAIIERELAAHPTAGLALTIEHAGEVVTMDDSPVESILSKPNSSLHVGYDLVKRGEVEGFVSAGNSGAILTTGIVILGTLPGVDRPAIATMVPTSHDLALLIDGGANTEAKSFNLVQFAVMGSVYWHHVRRIERPRVAILANGEEDSKGTELTRAAAATLRQMSDYVNFVGYVEGRDLNHGKVDVIVTDGFTGNAVLKTMEGFGRFMLGGLREAFACGLRGRLAYLLVRKHLGAMRAKVDPSEYGGAPLLGVSGIAIIAHGSSDPRAIRSALRAAAEEARSTNVNTDIVDMLARIPTLAQAKPEGRGFRGLLGRMRDLLHRHPRDQQGEGSSEPPIKAAVHPAGELKPALRAADNGAQVQLPAEPARPMREPRIADIGGSPNGAAPAQEAADPGGDDEGSSAAPAAAAESHHSPTDERS